MKASRIRKEKDAFLSFLKDRKNRKTIIMIIGAVILIAGMNIGKNLLSGMRYIVSENGNVKGVMREDTEKEESFPLKIEAEISGRKKRKDVTLIVKPDGEKDESADQNDYKRDASAVFDAEVSEMLNKLSRAGGKKIKLPGELSDGTKIIWRKGRGWSEILIIFMAPILIWLIYLNSEKKKQDAVKEKALCVQRELPAFNDELLLLLGSGLIFRDAFGRIAEGYRKKKKISYLDDQIIEIEDETKNGVSDIVNVISRKADEMQVTEFSRLAGLIRDNQLRGSDIMNKLRTESDILWDIRKKNAEERGRLAETKLTLPLAILLMVLVLVTAAPAIIQI